MKLAELEPQFLKVIDDKTSRYVDSIAEADGVQFLCPVCFQQGGGKIGCHSIICWRPFVSSERTPGPGRWEFKGTGYSDLTLVGVSDSIFLTTSSCKAHFFIRNGEIVNS